MSTEEMQRLDFGAGYGEGRCPQCGATRPAPELHGTETGRWSAAVPVPSDGPRSGSLQSYPELIDYIVTACSRFTPESRSFFIRARTPQGAIENFKVVFCTTTADSSRLEVRHFGDSFPVYSVNL